MTEDEVLFSTNCFFRGDHFRFGSVLKKIIKSKFLKNKTKPKPVQTDRFRFGSVWNPVQTGLTRFFWFWLVFFVWLGFFPV